MGQSTWGPAHLWPRYTGALDGPLPAALRGRCRWSERERLVLQPSAGPTEAAQASGHRLWPLRSRLDRHLRLCGQASSRVAQPGRRLRPDEGGGCFPRCSTSQECRGGCIATVSAACNQLRLRRHPPTHRLELERYRQRGELTESRTPGLAPSLPWLCPRPYAKRELAQTLRCSTLQRSHSQPPQSPSRRWARQLPRRPTERRDLVQLQACLLSRSGRHCTRTTLDLGGQL